MKSYRLHLELDWDIEAEDEEDALDKLAEQIAYNNETVENIFFEGMEVTENKDDDMAPSVVTIINPAAGMEDFGIENTNVKKG